MDEDNYTPEEEFEEPSYPPGKPRVLTSVNGMHIVPGELFPQICEATFTVNVRESYANTACVRLLPDTDYVQYLIDDETQMFGLLPCDRLDSHAFRWSRIKNGKRVPVHRTGKDFVLVICKIMDWNPNDRYKILGQLTEVEYKGQMVPVVSFDLRYKKWYRKPKQKGGKSTIVRDWVEMLGPVLEENDRSLRVSSINNYSVMSSENAEQTTTDETENPALEDTSSTTEQGAVYEHVMEQTDDFAEEHKGAEPIAEQSADLAVDLNCSEPKVEQIMMDTGDSSTGVEHGNPVTEQLEAREYIDPETGEIKRAESEE